MMKVAMNLYISRPPHVEEGFLHLVLKSGRDLPAVKHANKFLNLLGGQLTPMNINPKKKEKSYAYFLGVCLIMSFIGARTLSSFHL
jgi:hypothetical protein